MRIICRALLVVIVIAEVSTSGCAYAPYRTAPSRAQLPADLATYYAYPRQPQLAAVVPLRDEPRFREFLVRFPLTAPDFEPTEPVVEFEWFESRRPGRRPTILVNPILGGDYPLERGICRSFARQGFHVALIHRKTLKVSPEHPVSHLELLLRQGVLRIRQIVDWMEAQDEVDAARMASFGISMGGMASVIAAAVEPRLCCHVVALAGGSIPDILIASPDKLLAKPRANYLARNHLDLKTMGRLLRESVLTDPLRLAPYVDASRLFMVIALADRTIGRANALRLWQALGRPKAVFLPFGHYTAYLSLPYLKYASLRFYRQQLR